MSRYLSALQDYSSPNTCGEQSRWSEAAFRWKNGTAFCDLSSESVKVQAVLHHFYHHAWHKDRSINVYCAATRTPYDTWQIKPLNIKYLTSSSGSSLSILNPNTNISRKERCKKQWANLKSDEQVSKSREKIKSQDIWLQCCKFVCFHTYLFMSLSIFSPHSSL